MDGSIPAYQACTEDVTGLREIQRIIASMPRTAEEYTELAYDDHFLPQQRELSALPGILR